MFLEILKKSNEFQPKIELNNILKINLDLYSLAFLYV